MIPGTRVRWTTADNARARDELERQIEKRRESYASHRANQIIYRDFAHYTQDHPLETGEYVTVHVGELLSIAFQPESYAIAVSDRYRNEERHVKARWVALVVEDGGAIVEVDPRTLRVTSVPE